MLEYIKENYPDLLTMDGFDDAILGVVERIGIQAICYSERKIIDILMKRDGMDAQDAYDYFAFNIIGAYVGEHTPFVMMDVLGDCSDDTLTRGEQ